MKAFRNLPSPKAQTTVFVETLYREKFSTKGRGGKECEGNIPYHSREAFLPCFNCFYCFTVCLCFLGIVWSTKKRNCLKSVRILVIVADIISERFTWKLINKEEPCPWNNNVNAWKMRRKTTENKIRERGIYEFKPFKHTSLS